MNKFFIAPLFISVSLLAQEATMSRPKNKATGTYMPLLETADDYPGDAPARYPLTDYQAQPVEQFTTGQNPPIAPFVATLHNQTTNLRAAAESFDYSFNPRATAPVSPPVSAPVSPPVFAPVSAPAMAPVSPPAIQQPISGTTSSTSNTHKMVALEDNKPVDHRQHCISDECVAKKKARANLMMIMRTFYTHIDSSTSRDAIKKALKKQIEILKTELPAEKTIDQWFLNEPLDHHGNTMAHTAAINGDHALLEMLHKMGADVFKLNNNYDSPEQLAHKCFIADSPLTNEQKNLLLENESTKGSAAEDTTIVNETIENVDGKQKKKTKRKMPNKTTITTVTPLSVEQQRAQEKYRIEREEMQRESLQRRYERFRLLEQFYRKIKANKK